MAVNNNDFTPLPAKFVVKICFHPSAHTWIQVKFAFYIFHHNPIPLLSVSMSQNVSLLFFQVYSDHFPLDVLVYSFV